MINTEKGQRHYFLLNLILIMFICSVQFNLVKPYGNFSVTYYDELADAFLAGQLHLLRMPPPEMMALPNPSDPAANRSFRITPDIPGKRFSGLHDLTLYDGKLYLEWGALPALILIPLRWIVGHDLPMGGVVLVVATLAALLYAASVLKLARLSGLPPSRYVSSLLIIWFMLCPVWMFTLHRIAVYEIAMFFGQLCMSLSLFCAVVAFEQKLTGRGERLWLFALSGVFLGLMVNCRLNLAPLGLMVPVTLFLWWRTGPKHRPWRGMVGPTLALGGPAAFFLACALVYDLVRFGSFFEAGMSWQLTGEHVNPTLDNFHNLSLSRIVPNFWYYFFSPITIPADHPFIIAAEVVRPRDWMWPSVLANYDFYVEPTSGLFIVIPLTVLVLFSPLQFLKKSGDQNTDRARWIVPMLILSATLSGFLLFQSPASLRYAAEWCMWWLMAGTLMALQLRAGLRARKWRVASVLFDFALICATAWSGWVAICFLVVGGDILGPLK
jgi:hypothetical protein